MEKAMKKLAVIVVGIFFLAAIPLTVFLVGQRQELRKKAAPATTLALLPSAITKRVNDMFAVDVQIDTGENQVISADIHIVYDPDALEAQTVTNSTLFPSILSSGVVDRGTASITVGAPSNAQPVTGTGTIATVRFRAIAATQTPVSIRFAANTAVRSVSEGSTNLLVGTRPATVTVAADATGQFGGAASSSAGLLPTPTLLPQQASGSGSVASSSAVQILTPAQNTSTTSEQPTIKGKAPPGATVTITIYSDPQTVVVTADANGNWVYTPQEPLADGPHNVVATAQNPSTGAAQTATTTFVVASGQGSASESAVPIAGSSTPTILLILLGTLLLTSGIMVPIFVR